MEDKYVAKFDRSLNTIPVALKDCPATQGTLMDRTGDQIMGDDSKPRNVTSTCMGQEQMYKIKLENGDHFTCNESHILSLKYKEKYKQPAIVDISVKEYLKLDINVRSKLVCLFD